MKNNITTLIESGYADLRKSEKQAADYILEHLEQIPDLPIDRLAKEAQVSQPTVLRMLEETLKNFPGKTYKRVVEALRNARIIDIYSVENSEVVAVDLLTKLLYLGLPCRHFTDCYLQQIGRAHV